MILESTSNIIVQEKIKSKQWPQYLVILAASISAFCQGLHYSWSSPSFPKLLEDSYPLNITSEEASLVTVIFPLGDILGAPMMAYLSDIIGRKNGILLIALPSFLAWILIAFAQNIIMLYMGRFMAGIADGFLFLVYPMYAGEVTDPNVRGVLGCSLSCAMIVGMIVINTLAPFFSVRNTALICSIFPILLVVTFVWMPESPYFYLMKNKPAQAKESLTFLKRCDIEEDFQQLDKDVKRQMSERGSWKDLLLIDSNKKALFICLGIRTVQQFSGISAWSLFTQTVFTQAGGNLSPIFSTLIYHLVQLIMTCLGSVLLEKFGRKPLLMFSAIGSGIVLIIGGIYFYVKEMTTVDINSLSWLPIFVMICYIIIFGLGLGTIPSLMLSELFSTSIKGKALCIMGIYYALMISITSKLFYVLIETFGMYAAFFTFGSACLISVLFLYYFVPETKGKSLEDIQQYFKQTKKQVVL